MSSDSTPSKDTEVDEEMRRISEVTKPNPGNFAKPSGNKAADRGSNEAAGFSLPFGWGKKKKDNQPQAAPPPAAPPPAAPPVEQPQAQAPQTAPAAKQDRKYTVQPGDTLWDLAARFYGDGRQYPKIARANDIPDPNMINIGVELKIPD